MGRRIGDLDGVEGPEEEADGLGLLDVETDMLTKKLIRPLNGICLENNQQVHGYEIHMGETTGADTRRRYIQFDHNADGAVNAEGNVVGCYVHGLFWSDSFRSAWLNQMRKSSASTLQYHELIEQSLDELADELERVLDIDGLLADANWC